MTLEKINIFKEDLEETILRLHTYLRSIEEEYDQFKKRPVWNKEKKINFDKRKKEYIYYKGKFYAYLYVLNQLESDVPKIIERLRGITDYDDNTMIETKMYYSEIKGHFPTQEYLKIKKVIK